MKIIKTVPEQQQEQKIEAITFYVTTKNVVCHLDKEGDTKGIGVDITPALNAATATQRQTLVTFFKWIMGQAFEEDEATLPDTVFDPDV